MIQAALWIAIVATAALLGVYAILFLRFTNDLRDQSGGYTQPAQVPAFAQHALSVIICAHNEAANLAAFLPKVLQQQYHFADGALAYEVIVVDDASRDDTASVLKSFQQSWPHLRVVRISADAPRPLPGKKFPLSQGLAAARHRWIVCTDADCVPASLHWLHYMAAPLLAGKEIVAGYGGMAQRRGWLNAFIRCETEHTFLQYFSFTRLGLPYMAVGRNLAATKDIFLQAQSAEVWKALPSGDDDLLVQLCGNRRNMAVIAHPASFTWTEGKENLKDYLSQKRRHVSTSKFYSLLTKMLLGMYALAHLLWWMVLVFLLILAPDALVPWVVLALPMLLWVLSMQQAARFLGGRGSMLRWCAFSLCWVGYNAVLAPFMLWKTKQRWR